MDQSWEQNAGLTRRRWLVLAAACLINLCIGSMYAWSVLAAPMARELGTGSLSVVFSTANAVGFLTMILGGLLNDKYGPRWVVFSGGVMFGVGMFCCGFARSTADLVLFYGVVLGLGMSLVYGCTISNTIKFFPDRRGLIGGLTTASYGISSVIFAAVGNALNAQVGVRASFRILGAVFLVGICAGAFLLRRCPDGFLPRGYTPPERLRQSAGADKTPLEMLKMPVFYVMLLMLTCGGTFGMMIISSASSLAVHILGCDATKASLLVSMLCLFNTLGRLAAGSLSDRLGRVRTLRGAFGAAVLALLLLMAAEKTASAPCFAAGLALVGVCFGTFMGVFPGFCTDRFGTRHNTVNYGIMWIGFSLAGILGPTILSSLYGARNRYAPAFAVAVVLAGLGLALTFVYGKMSRKLEESTEPKT